MNTNDQIIELLGSGFTVKELSNILGMNKKTVEKRISTMKKKLQCKTVTQLVVKSLGLGKVI